MKKLFKTLFTPEKMEWFHFFSVNAKRFQMVPEVIKMEEKGVLSHKIQFSFVFGE